MDKDIISFTKKDIEAKIEALKTKMSVKAQQINALQNQIAELNQDLYRDQGKIQLYRDMLTADKGENGI